MYTQELDVAKKISKQSGTIMLEYFDGDQQRKMKQDGSPVTVADTAINAMVIAELSKAFPGDIVIGEEESTGGYGLGRRWFCDPIDGTKAFTWGVPTAMFSLGLVVDGEAVIGVCYNPVQKLLFSAIRGEGAYFNDRRLFVNENNLENGIFAIASSPEEVMSDPFIHELVAKKYSLAIYSGAVHKAISVARGRFTGYVERRVNAYDVAAINVIVEEAGGVVTDLTGKPYNYTQPIKGTVVSNGKIHQQIVDLIGLV